MGEEWEVFMRTVMARAREVCGLRNVGGGQVKEGEIRKYSAREREKREEKREVYGGYLQTTTESCRRSRG